MVTSVNKGYALIATGDEVDTWGDKLNAAVFTLIDNNLGGVVTKTLSNVQVNLDATESQMLRLVLNGTLTGNVLVTTQCVGMTVVDNQCTGNFTVSFQKFGVGTPIAIPNGTRNLITTGGSGDPATIGIDFPPGTRIPFQQTTPPPGYSKEAGAAYTDAAMQFTTGTVGTGGSQAFGTVFTATRQPTGSVQQMTLDITQIPSHQHLVATAEFGGGGDHGELNNSSYLQGAHNFGNSNTYTLAPTGTPANACLSSGIGGSQPHTHGLNLGQMNFDTKFVQCSIGIKT